ncbi:hypothetical protein LguiB_011689 [Lonicera macranthoides]
MMASNGKSRMSVNIESPKGGNNNEDGTTTTAAATVGGSMKSSSPKGITGQCLCSPTTHQGSFRCRFHRSNSTTATWFKRSNSMPAPGNSATSLSPKSVEST